MFQVWADEIARAPPDSAAFKLRRQLPYLYFRYNSKQALKRAKLDVNLVLGSMFSIVEVVVEGHRTLRSSRSTDAKASETPAVDDVIQIHSPNRSSGKQRVKKKMKRER